MSSHTPRLLRLFLCFSCFCLSGLTILFSTTALAQVTSEETPLEYWQSKAEVTPATPDEAQLKQLHADLWAAIERRELPALRQAWSTQPAATAAFERFAKLSLLTSGKLKVLFSRVVYLAAQNQAGSVRSFTATRRFAAETGKLLPSPGRYMYITTCVKEDGQWKIADFAPTLIEVATRLAAVAEPSARETIWQSYADTHVIELTWAATSRGFQHYRQGNYVEAARFFEVGYWLGAEKFQHKLPMAISLTNLGAIYLDRSDYAKSLDYSLRAAALLRDLSDQRMQEGLAHTTNNIGEVYKKQGNYGLALQYLNESLRVAETNGFQSLISDRLVNLAGVYQEQGRFDLALPALERSQKLAQELNSVRLLSQTQLALAQMHLLQADYQRAAEQAQQALAGFGDSKYWKANALTMYSQALYGLGEYARAIEQAELAVPIAKETGQRDAYWEARATQGQALRALGRWPEARAAFAEAIQVIEDIRANLMGDQALRQSFFARKLSPYREMVELLLAQQEPELALRYAEQGKARALLEVLQSGQSNLTNALTSQEQETEQRLNAELAGLNAQLLSEYSGARPPNLAQLQNLQAALQKKRLEQTDFTTRLYAAHPELKLQRGLTSEFNMPLVANQLLDDQTALLEYVVGTDATQLFVITQKAGKPQLKVWRLPVKNQVLRAQVSQYRTALATRNLQFRSLARQLYETLLQPAQTALSGKTKLIIVPDSSLWELPFQALQTAAGQYVTEKYALAYAPSLSALSEMTRLEHGRRSSNLTGSLLAFGNPALLGGNPDTIAHNAPLRGGGADSLKFAPLPQAEQEVITIAQLYGANSKVYLGETAREATFKEQAGTFDILHLAAHSYLNNQHPLYSFVVLSQQDNRAAPLVNQADGKVPASEDGLLEAWELMRLKLRPRLVVLSACETARGQISEGEGVIGLSWALFVAGAPTAVVSQWKVDANSTTDLMINFHRQLRARQPGQTGGMGAACALQQASLKLLKGKYKHPFYWAGFVVIGDGF